MKRAPNEKRLCGSNQHSSIDQCLTIIVTELMVLLTMKSEFRGCQFPCLNFTFCAHNRVQLGGVHSFFMLLVENGGY